MRSSGKDQSRAPGPVGVAFEEHVWALQQKLRESMSIEQQSPIEGGALKKKGLECLQCSLP